MPKLLPEHLPRPFPHSSQDDALIRFLADLCPGRRIKCTLSRDVSQSHGNAYLQSATLDLPDAECAETLLLHADGAVFMGRRLTVVDPVAEAAITNSSKDPATSDAKTFAKVRAACELLPSASLDQLRSIMSLLERVSQSDAEHLRQVLLSNPELSLALARAAERLQILDQPLKHVEAPAAPPNATAAGSQAAVAMAAAGGGYRPPSTGAPPPPPPVNLPIEVQQALEMLLREYGLVSCHLHACF